MQLYFMRHGLAQDNASGAMPDAERALVPEGVARSRRTAQVLQQLGVRPDCLCSSPLLRARQTADILGETLHIGVTIRPELDFNFSLARLAALTADRGRDQVIVLVGHEPSLSETIAALIGGGEISMKKGALARVDMTESRPHGGVLMWLLPPKLLDALDAPG